MKLKKNLMKVVLTTILAIVAMSLIFGTSHYYQNTKTIESISFEYDFDRTNFLNVELPQPTIMIERKQALLYDQETTEFLKDLISRSSERYVFLDPVPTISPTPIPKPTPRIINRRIQPVDGVPLYQQCNLSEKEFEFFARVVRAEAGTHKEGQIWVAEVIWNRTTNSYYKGTVTHVLTQSGQFSVVRNGSCSTPASDDSRKAIVIAYLNRILPSGVIAFRSGHYHAGRPRYGYCGGNYFSY